MLLNLLENAVKFLDDQPQPRIEVGHRTDGGETVFFVRDNGVGFDMATSEKLFQPFQRLHKPEDFEGNGIGLATAERIVKRHGGRMWAEAAVDSGAAFYFSILPNA